MFLMIFPLVLIVAIVILFIISKKTYGNQYSGIDKSIYKMADIIFIGAYLGYDILGGRHLNWFPKQYEKVYKNNVRIHGRQDAQRETELFYMEKLTWVVLVAFICSIFALLSGIGTFNDVNSYNPEVDINRPEYGEGRKIIHYNVKAKDEKDSYLFEDVEVIIPEKEPSFEQLKEAALKLKEGLAEIILDKNEEFEFIGYDLNLIDHHKRTKFDIIWELEENSLLYSDGHLKEEIQSPKKEKLVAKFFYDGMEIDQVEYDITLVPENTVLSRENLIKKQIALEVEDIKNGGENLQKDQIRLRSELKADGDEILLKWMSENFVESDYSMVFNLFLGGILLAAFIYFGLDQNLDKVWEQKNLLIKREFPTFVDKFVLLLNSGNSVNQALSNYIESLEQNNPDKLNHPLYKELSLTLYDIENSGISNIDAFEQFGKRIELNDVMKFSSLVAQSIKRGDKEIGLALKEIVKEAWENKKLLAKEEGAKASSKLLMPMMIMLIAVMILVIYPAITSFGGL